MQVCTKNISLLQWRVCVSVKGPIRSICSSCVVQMAMRFRLSIHLQIIISFCSFVNIACYMSYTVYGHIFSIERYSTNFCYSEGIWKKQTEHMKMFEVLSLNINV